MKYEIRFCVRCSLLAHPGLLVCNIYASACCDVSWSGWVFGEAPLPDGDDLLAQCHGVSYFPAGPVGAGEGVLRREPRGGAFGESSGCSGDDLLEQRHGGSHLPAGPRSDGEGVLRREPVRVVFGEGPLPDNDEGRVQPVHLKHVWLTHLAHPGRHPAHPDRHPLVTLARLTHHGDTP